MAIGQALLGNVPFTMPTQIGLQPGGTGQPLGENMVRSETGEILLRLPDGRLISPYTFGESSIGTGGTFTPMATTAPVTPSSIPSMMTDLPPLRGGAAGESRIDPTLRPYLELGLQRGEQLFFGPGPQMYPGQTYVSPAQQYLDALQAQETLARAAPGTLQAGQTAFERSMQQTGETAGGAFLGGSPYLQNVIESATRPITQQLTEQTLPAIASGFSRAGRYGSGAMERATSGATEKASQAIGDIASQLAYGDYARERGYQQQAIGQQAQLAGMAPQFYAQQFLPSQQLAQVGQAQMALQEPVLAEAIRRYEYQQQLPYQQLQGFLSGVYGTPMGGSQLPTAQQPRTNTTLQNLSAISTIAGAFPDTRERVEDWVAKNIFGIS